MPDRNRHATVPPVTDAEFARLAGQSFAGAGSIILAVSGGPDSMALMHLAARWRAATDALVPRLLVATVDHGLRPGSGREAAWVAACATELGLAHEILVWDGPRPKTRIQEKARAARYALLARLADRVRPAPCTIAVAHHRDDQAETLLMRLARGSGIDGLSAMQEARALVPPSPMLVRPLLTVPKDRLLATLVAFGHEWIEDPSNDIVAFERVRLRGLRTVLDSAGLTNDQLAKTARRLARAREALEQATHDLAERAVRLNDGAYAAIDAESFDRAPEELRLRLLQRLIGCFGGASPPARLSQLETLTERLAARPPRFASTLGGTLVRSEADGLRIYREPGRRGLPHLSIGPGESAIWDRRFLIEIDVHCPHQVDIRSIAQNLLTSIKRQRVPAQPILPRRAALTIPSAWNGDRLLALLHPALAKLATDDRSTGDARFVKATFLPAPGDRFE